VYTIWSFHLDSFIIIDAGLESTTDGYIYFFFACM